MSVIISSAIYSLVYIILFRKTTHIEAIHELLDAGSIAGDLSRLRHYDINDLCTRVVYFSLTEYDLPSSNDADIKTGDVKRKMRQR